MLDEIGDLPVNVQVKLLRVLEQRQYTAVGDVRPRECNVRILAATNVDLKRACDEGRFREDLYYRLAAVQIHVPPLREHLEDLEQLVVHFLQLAGHPQAEGSLSTEVLDELRRRPWYGNVRELRNAIEHAVVHSRGRGITIDHLPPPQPQRLVSDTESAKGDLAMMVRDWADDALQKLEGPIGALHDDLMHEVEPALFAAVLQKTNGNRAAAAEILGIHRGTLRERMQRYSKKGDE